MDERLDPERLSNLRSIGVDEFSYRKRHNYLTIVVDHYQEQIVWAAPGRSSETLKGFFDLLSDEVREAIEFTTIDMSGGYRKAIEEALPNAEIVYDRFHVQRLASNAVDEIRRDQLRELRGTEEGKALFRSRFSLLRRWDITSIDKQRISAIQKTNAPLYRAYLLNAALADALDYRRPSYGERALRAWLAWASRSRLKPFVRVARTIRKHFGGIMAYIRNGLTNGIAEGFNNRLRMVARRAFGFHTPGSLIAMAYLCCGGIELKPPLPRPTT